MYVLLAALLVPLALQEAPIEVAPGWTTRYPGREAGKDALVTAGGGSGATEAAIQLALQWLARHQSNDGSWGAAGFQDRCIKRKCSDPGNRTFDVGTTGLALLAFLGAGQGVQSTATWTQTGAPDQPLPFGPVVAKGLRWLLSKQDEAGCFGPQGEKHLYNHFIAAQTVGDAAAMTGSPLLKTATQNALRYTAYAQNPGKAWRYNPMCNDNDTSVTGWAVMSLKAAEAAGVPVSVALYNGTLTWLDDATEPNGLWQTGYNARSTGKVVLEGVNTNFSHHTTMSAIAMLSRQLIQKKRNDSELKGVELLKSDPPRWKINEVDFYYWYWGSLAYFQLEGGAGAGWKAWFDATRDALLKTIDQGAAGCSCGSWDAYQERWAAEGGRVYVTALGAMVLETPYRYPLAVPVPAAKKKK